jgi:hypothetical protein
MSLAGTSQAADPGIDDMSIDMDPSGAPANTKGTTGTDGVVGSIETCARVNENNIMDADEDSVDTLLIDITAKGIGASSPVISFGATLNFPDSMVKVASVDTTGQLISAFPGSSPLDASNAVPKTVSPFVIAGADTAADTFESGDGPLARVGIESVTGSQGLGDLSLINAGILSYNDSQYVPATLGDAKVAVNRSCTGPAFLRGDVDCSGGDPSSVDALKILRHVAKLTVTQTEPCTDIGDEFGVAVNTGTIQGDINCDDSITSVDALFILRFVAKLNVNLPDGCPAIGS